MDPSKFSDFFEQRRESGKDSAPFSLKVSSGNLGQNEYIQKVESVKGESKPKKSKRDKGSKDRGKVELSSQSSVTPSQSSV